MVTGPSGGDKAEAEQALLDRAVLEYAWVFTKRRLWVMDRNFPGVARIERMIKVTHVLIRLKSDITVTKIGGFLPDGSYMADIGGKDGKIRMRVIEYYVEVEGQDVPEMFCLVTDLDDWQAYPAGMLAAAYKWRWDGSETALREAKSAIRGAGPSTGPIFRSHPGHDPPGTRRLDHRRRTRPRCRPRRCRPPPRPARDAAPGIPFTPGRSPSPPPAAPPSPPPAPAPLPPACPARSPRPAAMPPSATWAGAASPSTVTGTVTTRPRPGRHSPPPDAAPPPATHPPGSPSAAPSPPEHRPRQSLPLSCTRRPWNRPPPRSDIRASRIHHERDHRPQPPRPLPTDAPQTRNHSSTWHWGSAWIPRWPGDPMAIDAGTFALVTLPTSAFWARRYIRHFLGSCRGISVDTADTAELLVSELVTNAVRFAGGPTPAQPCSGRVDAGLISLSLRHFGEVLLIEVLRHGQQSARPVVDADAYAENGRGLMLIDGLTKVNGRTSSRHAAAKSFTASGDPVMSYSHGLTP